MSSNKVTQMTKQIIGCSTNCHFHFPSSDLIQTLAQYANATDNPNPQSPNPQVNLIAMEMGKLTSKSLKCFSNDLMRCQKCR